MNLEEKIGQMIMLGFQGVQASVKSEIVKTINQCYIGGVILFNKGLVDKSGYRNIQSPAQVKQLISDIQAPSKTPLFVATDMEGGRVSRLAPEHGFPPIPAPAEYAQIKEPMARKAMASKLALMQQELGFNLDFAPSVDLNINPHNPIIGAMGRSFSDDAEVVIHCASEQLEALQANKIIGCIKHFPGHGSSQTDSHLGFVDITETWQPSELMPYQHFIKQGIDMVMVSHLYHAKYDQRYPATLSYGISTNLLREKLGFEGVAVSDDMMMHAITDNYDFETAIELAVNAGVDMLVYGNNIDSYVPKLGFKVYSTLLKLVKSGVISIARVEEAWGRIMRLKERVLVSQRLRETVGNIEG